MYWPCANHQLLGISKLKQAINKLLCLYLLNCVCILCPWNQLIQINSSIESTEALVLEIIALAESYLCVCSLCFPAVKIVFHLVYCYTETCISTLIHRNTHKKKRLSLMKQIWRPITRGIKKLYFKIVSLSANHSFIGLFKIWLGIYNTNWFYFFSSEIL